MLPKYLIAGYFNPLGKMYWPVQHRPRALFKVGKHNLTEATYPKAPNAWRMPTLGAQGGLSEAPGFGAVPFEPASLKGFGHEVPCFERGGGGSS